MITHELSETAFARLAAGEADQTVVGELRQAQYSKHTMLLVAIAAAARQAATGQTGDAAPELAAFHAAYRLLTRIQETSPGDYAWLLALPHLAGWAHDTLIRLDQASAPDFAYLASLGAAAAIRARMPFELAVPVRDGSVLLPGLGRLDVAPGPGQERKSELRQSWVRLRGDVEQVTAGGGVSVPQAALRPDDGTGPLTVGWHGTPAAHAVADGMTWNVLLATDDAYLDRYTLPMSAGLPASELRRWRDWVQSAWAVLTRHHRWAAGPIADGVTVIVPLTPRAATDLISATSPAAFGAIATSWPPDPVTLAETLVHEFQHVTLCGLLDLVPLTNTSGARVYAPWRQDPRPAAGLLQGVYAHLGIIRFWRTQRHAETDPDARLRAEAQYARWCPAIDLAVDTLQRTGCLTPAGVRFTGLLRARSRELAAGPVPRQAGEIAREAALDHWLTWQIRHMAVDGAAAARLAAAYRRGESYPAAMQPGIWVSQDVRKLSSSVRSRLLALRYLDPARYRELVADEVLPISAPDRLLFGPDATAAVQAYRDQIAGTVDPQPDAWVGLTLALHRLPPSSLRATLADRLPVAFEVHSQLGVPADPLDLAGWFG